MAEQEQRYKSIFGPYAENIEVIAKALEAREQRPLFREFMTYGDPSIGLTYSTILGSEAVAPAASIVEIEALHPLRGRIAPARADGDIPAIKVKRSLGQKQYREYLALRNMPGIDKAKNNQILNFITKDMKYVVDAVDNRIDYMFQQGLSNGWLVTDTNNNPDGVTHETVSIGTPEENITQAAKSLSDATATPVTYINKVVEDSGKTFGNILLTPSLWNKLKVNKEFLDEMKAFYNPGSNARAVFGFQQFNDYMTANRLPNFRIIDKTIPIETDGNKRVFHRPFNENNMVFVPSGNLGIIHNAYHIEELEPADNVDYASVNRTMVSKWQTRFPWGEYTAGDSIAIPGFEAAEDIYILKANF